MNSKIKVKHPIGIQWKIPEARLREKITKYLKSNTFGIPGTDVKYYVSFFPNGDNDDRREESRMYLELIFNEEKEIESEFTISIESANYAMERKPVYKQSFGWGGQICTTDELLDPAKRFIVDGEMIIKVEGFLMIEKDVPTKLFDLGSGGNILGINLWNQEYKDFTIVADGKEITAHKFVLSAQSPVFAAMFKPHTQEAQENKVTIPDFPFNVVETAVKLCYDSRLVENIPFDDQMSLLQFFDKYDIQSLKTDLENLMISVMDESNVCRLANCSLLSNASKLQKKCGELLQKCFRANQLVIDFNILDKDFVFDMVKNSLFKLSL